MAQEPMTIIDLSASRWPTARASGWKCRSRWSPSSWPARPTSPSPGRRRCGSRSPGPATASPSGSTSRSTSRARACAASSRRALDLEVEAREIDQAGTDDPELRSPYVADDELDIGRWAHDAAILALPTRILCRPDCAGLCPVCGESPQRATRATSTRRRPTRAGRALKDLKLE